MLVEVYNISDHEILDILIGDNAEPVSPAHIYKQHGILIHSYKTNNFLAMVNELILLKDVEYAILIKINDLDQNKIVLIVTDQILIHDGVDNKPQVVYEN